MEPKSDNAWIFIEYIIKVYTALYVSDKEWERISST